MRRLFFSTLCGICFLFAAGLGDVTWTILNSPNTPTRSIGALTAALVSAALAAAGTFSLRAAIRTRTK